MTLPTLYDLCDPRDDIRLGTASDADFAADLARVLREDNAPPLYADPARFFANTYPTRGLKNLLGNVCARLSGRGGAVAAIFRLDTSFGGGKTHGLIALAHAARGMQGVAEVSEFLDPALVPKTPVRIAAFDGENADPANGRRLAPNVLARTPWGELAYALAGREGYERVRPSDEAGVAPGAETLRELLGNSPALVLLDELAVYLRKVAAKPGARDQLTAFLTALFKAIEGSPNAALVYTLAVGKEGRATDAYSEENQFVADRMAEAESISARKATLLNPTEDDETAQVLLRRLFARIDRDRAAEVVAAYKQVWSRNREALSLDAAKPETMAAFRESYPLHPEVLEVLTKKTATLGNFQRVRGMLRLLARTVQKLWQDRPADAHAIHLHHIDPGFEPIRQEITTRLGLGMFVPALRADIAGEGGKRALAEEIDWANHRGLPPYATYVARTIFLHSLAFNEPLKGVRPEELRYAIAGPALDVTFIEEARKAFIAQSAYLDDRPGVPMRFLAEANLTQIIRREEQNVDPQEVRAQLNDVVRSVFQGPTLDLVLFPAGPWDVPDDIGENKPRLVVLSPDAVTVAAGDEAAPELVRRIYEEKGAEGSGFRLRRNNLLFVVAEEGRVQDMRAAMSRRLALQALMAQARLAELAEHQHQTVLEEEKKARAKVAIAVQQCFRHVFYPSDRNRQDSRVTLAHTALDTHSVSEKPGAGQDHVVRHLSDIGKLRRRDDQPDAPAYIRDRTPLRKGQITTAALRDEFRRDPALPMLVDDEVFVRGIRLGVERGEFVYRKGDLVYGPGDPHTEISLGEDAAVFTMAYATEQGLWPRRVKETVSVSPQQAGEPSEGAKASGLAETTGAMPSPAPGGDVTAPAKPAGETLRAEGVLREALRTLFDQAAAQHVAAIARLSIRPFDVGDCFKLLGVVTAVRAGEVRASLECEAETQAGSAFEVRFEGRPQDALPLRDFLEPQIKVAAERDVRAVFTFTFEDGLPVKGEGPQRLIDQLTRFAAGAAYVEAEAEPKR